MRIWSEVYIEQTLSTTRWISTEHGSIGGASPRVYGALQKARQRFYSVEVSRRCLSSTSSAIQPIVTSCACLLGYRLLTGIRHWSRKGVDGRNDHRSRKGVDGRNDSSFITHPVIRGSSSFGQTGNRGTRNTIYTVTLEFVGMRQSTDHRSDEIFFKQMIWAGYCLSCSISVQNSAHWRLIQCLQSNVRSGL